MEEQKNDQKTEEAPSLYPFLNAVVPLFFSIGALYEIWHDNLLQGLLFVVLGMSWTVMDLKKEVAALHAHFHERVTVAVVVPKSNPTQE